MRYLLDTNIIIYALKNKYPRIKEHFLHVSPSAIFIPSVVLGEIEYGCRKSNDYETNITNYRKFTDVFSTLSFGEKESQVYGLLRSELERNGNIIGGNDMLIASIALSNDCTIVTNNVREFERIPGLKIEDWTK